MENEENVVRLAKPVKKGLLHLVFSRFLIIGLLLVLQVLIVIAAYGFLADKLPYFVALTRVFATIMIIYLFNSDMDSTAKLTWMLVISIIPITGTAFLLFTQMNFGHRKTQEMVEEQIRISRQYLEQPKGVLRKVTRDSSAIDDLCRYVNRTGCFPLYDHTAVSYFPLGEDKFEAMLVELEKAEKFIFMEYFILEEGYMWGRILDILIRKAKAGVDVRVLYDGMCEMSTLPPDYWKLLEEQGIQSGPFAPIMPFISSHYNYRDHRKICVID